MNTKLLSKLTVGAIAAASLISSASIANAGIIKFTDPQTDSFGPQQTDWDETFTFQQFDPDTDVELDPGEVFGSFNSVHILLSASGVAGPGAITCVTPGGNGLCEGVANTSLIATLSIPDVPDDLASVEIDLNPGAVPVPWSIQQGETFIVETAENADSIELVYDLKELLPSDLTEAEIEAVLSAFLGSGTIDVLADADGDFDSGTVTGFTTSGSPITAEISAEIFYDYHVEPVMDDVPEPGSLLGLGLIGGLGLLAKRQKS